jgi:hypothetical protein
MWDVEKLDKLSEQVLLKIHAKIVKVAGWEDNRHALKPRIL